MTYFKNFKGASVCFDQSNLRFRSIENRMRHFFKTKFPDESNTFSKSFLTFLSPYDSVKAHLPFFVIFNHSFCKVFLSQGWYVRFTLPFAFYFMFSCINSWFLGKFLNLCKFGIFVDSSQIF